ncbi:MAG: flagellar hook assembly protein FlgD [Pseudomonadales bacterium]|nr:flagellar hook assembly protein FlgD [Pseudomonadales bacterium]
MNEISSSNALDKILGELAIQKQDKKTNELGRDEFLKLLIAQLENQDPTQPQENGEFIAQLAQFSSLEESQKLSRSFESFAGSFQSTQHLQATSLVGRPVHVASDFTMLDSTNAVSVLADFPTSVQSATLSVFSSNGELVEKFELGGQEAGRNEFIWTGVNAQDERFPPGLYKFSVQTSNGGEASNVPLFLSANVNSVTIEPGGTLTLNLAGIGETALGDVIQIN